MVGARFLVWRVVRGPVRNGPLTGGFRGQSPLKKTMRPEGFEPPTYWFEARFNVLGGSVISRTCDDSQPIHADNTCFHLVHISLLCITCVPHIGGWLGTGGHIACAATQQVPALVIARRAVSTFRFANCGIDRFGEICYNNPALRVN